MAEENPLDIVKSFNEQDAQVAKDQLIDDIIRLVNQFTNKWNVIVGRKTQLEQKIHANDKIVS